VRQKAMELALNEKETQLLEEEDSMAVERKRTTENKEEQVLEEEIVHCYLIQTVRLRHPLEKTSEKIEKSKT